MSRRWPRGWRRGPRPRRATSPRRVLQVCRWWWRAAQTSAPTSAPSVSPSLTPPLMNFGVWIFDADLAGFAGEERQQEEPPRATPKFPPPSTTPPRGASPARASTTQPTHMEEEEANLGAGGSAPATNADGEGATSSQPGVGKLFAFYPYSFFSFFFLLLPLFFIGNEGRRGT